MDVIRLKLRDKVQASKLRLIVLGAERRYLAEQAKQNGQDYTVRIWEIDDEMAKLYEDIEWSEWVLSGHATRYMRDVVKDASFNETDFFNRDKHIDDETV